MPFKVSISNFETAFFFKVMSKTCKKVINNKSIEKNNLIKEEKGLNYMDTCVMYSVCQWLKKINKMKESRKYYELPL